MTGSGSRWAELGRRRLDELRRLAERKRFQKTLRVLAIASGVLFAGYLVFGNVLLRFGGLEWLVSQGTKDARVTLGPSYTWFPGQVVVRDFTLRFEDQNVQFELALPRAKATLNLFALAQKRIHVRAIDADGARFLFRHKVVSTAGNEKRLPNFPRIEGFPDPPLLKVRPPSDKTDDWAFLLENVTARAAELWFMEYRFQGQADVAGAFELAPGRKLWVGPARVEFMSGKLTIGEKRPLGNNFKSTLDFRFREANPDPIPGLEIFRQVSAKLVFDGNLVDLEAANLYLSDASRVRVAGGAARVQARLEVRDGTIARESALLVHGTEDVRVAFSDSDVHGRFALELKARGHEGQPVRLLLDTTLTSPQLVLDASQRAERPDVRASLVRVFLATDNSDIAKPWMLDEASFRVEGGRADDLGVFDRSPPSERLLESGSGWFQAYVELSREKTWSGTLRADARRATLHVGKRKVLLDGSLSGAAESSRRDLESGALRDLTLEVRDMTPGEHREPGLAVKIRAPSVTWSGFPPRSASGRATLESPQIEPLLEVLGAPALLVNLWPNAPVQASARFNVERDALDVKLDVAKSGPFHATGRLRVCSPANGAFLVRSGAARFGVAVRGKTVRVVPLVGAEWLKENAPDCPGGG